MKYQVRAKTIGWARALARRYGEAQLAPFGSWSLLLAALLVGAAGALALWVMVADPSERRPRLPGRLARWRRIAGVPVAAWACALVALLNGAAWSLIVPVLAGGDERNHVAYVQYLAETGSPPSGRTARAFSEEERNLQKGLGIERLVRQGIEARPFTTRADHIRLEQRRPRGETGLVEGGQTSATNNPPGYYAVEAVVYRLTSWAGLFNRIHAMRFVSALMGALAVLLVFLFLRELLPRIPWAWSVGSLAVAFVPLFGDISGTVKEDNLAFAACAGLLLSLVISFRHGLTPRRGLAIGAFAAGRGPDPARRVRAAAGRRRGDRPNTPSDPNRSGSPGGRPGRRLRGRRGRDPGDDLRAAQHGGLGSRSPHRPSRRPPLREARRACSTTGPHPDRFLQLPLGVLPARAPGNEHPVSRLSTAICLVRAAGRGVRLRRARAAGTGLWRSPSPSTSPS